MSSEIYQQLMQQALAASTADDSAMAIRLWTEASCCEPPSATPHLLLGAEHAQLGQIEDAEAAFANAILLSPTLLIARFQLGLLQFTSGRVGIAMLTWQPLLQAAPDGSLSRFVEGFAALAQDKFEEAIANFETGIARNVDNAPLNTDMRMVIERTIALMAAGESDEATVKIPQAESLTPSEDRSEEHILLANYQQYGLPH